MRKRIWSIGVLLLACILCCLLVAGCSALPGSSSTQVQNPEYERTPPPLRLPEYVGEVQETFDDGTQSGFVDVTNINDGYFAASYAGPKIARIQIAKQDGGEGDTSIYYVDTDGTVNFYPISRGSGNYTITMYISQLPDASNSLYDTYIVQQVEVQLVDELSPFLVPGRSVDYDAESACVQESYVIAQHCQSNLEVVQQVYAWVAANIQYDNAKAELYMNKTGDYKPDPDATLQAKTGICYDYASLTAAMLRANGVPTQVIKGQVYTEDGAAPYHAWNMVWLEETGWVAAELVVNPHDWTRLDTTFASAGSQYNRFIGDGQNYVDQGIE